MAESELIRDSESENKVRKKQRVTSARRPDQERSLRTPRRRVVCAYTERMETVTAPQKNVHSVRTKESHKFITTWSSLVQSKIK